MPNKGEFMLEQDELLIYIRKAKEGDENAKEIIFKNNEPLLKSIIRRFKNKGIEYDDLYQLASIGLLKAINNFDESFGVKFSTYTLPMVIGEIKRYIRDNGAIKVSRSLKILANKIGKFIDEYQTKNNDSPTLEAIAEKFGVEKDEVIFALDSVKMPLSLYEKADECDDNNSELIDRIPSGFNQDELIDKIQLNNLIEDLPEREKKLIILRYFRDRTQSEIAESLGVSQVQVSRLETRIIDKIRLNF